MAIRCSKCGEELLGAVNRCWRCGQAVVVAPQTPTLAVGSVPVAAGGEQAVEAVIVETAGGRSVPNPYVMAGQRPAPRMTTTGELIDARRAQMMAMGGTVASLVLGIFGAILAMFWPPAALVAVLGLAMGIWGLSSSRRNLALVGMLLCCLAIGIGAYGMARNISIAMQKNRAIPFEESPPVDPN